MMRARRVRGPVTGTIRIVWPMAAMASLCGPLTPIVAQAAEPPAEAVVPRQVVDAVWLLPGGMGDARPRVGYDQRVGAARTWVRSARAHPRVLVGRPALFAPRVWSHGFHRNLLVAGSLSRPLRVSADESGAPLAAQ